MSKVTFDQVSNVFNTLEGTSSRNEMTQILADFFKDLKLKEAQILSYLVVGRVAPSFVRSEFNYSEKSFLSLLNKLLKSKSLEVDSKEKREELGDIGDTLEYYSRELGQKTGKLSLVQIYKILWQIVNAKGTGSIEVKNRIITETLKQLSPLEAKYFSRIVCGSLRFGLSSKTLLDVFSFVVQGDKGMKEEMERAYGAYTDMGYICSLIVDTPKEKVMEKLHSVKVQPGTPILPRLVERVSSFEEVFERLGDTVFVQSKYDGLRCQIHKFRRKDFQSKDSIWQEYIKESDENTLFENPPQEEYVVRLFTRNLEDVTEMFPEIVEQARKVKEESFIMDSEVLGWNTEKEEFLTFQETMQRRRKYNVKKMQGSVPVKAMVFDLLYLNGNVLLGEDLDERLEILEKMNTDGGIETEETKKVKNLKELREIFDRAVKLGLEGIIVKQIKGEYLPGVRNYEWIKLKKSMLKGLVDTMDLVVVGYNFGSGRRSELGVGSILGASYNEKEDLFETVCNVGTGFTDEQLKTIYTSLKGDIVEEKPKNVKADDWLIPDVWVEPRVVFTVEADEITKKKGSDGFSLRFPRLVEWGRDKGITEATTIKELGEMYGG